MIEIQQLYYSTLGQGPAARIRPRAVLTGCVRCSPAAAPGIRYTPEVSTYNTLTLSLCSTWINDDCFESRVGVSSVEHIHGEKRGVENYNSCEQDVTL